MGYLLQALGNIHRILEKLHITQENIPKTFNTGKRRHDKTYHVVAKEMA